MIGSESSPCVLIVCIEDNYSVGWWSGGRVRSQEMQQALIFVQRLCWICAISETQADATTEIKAAAAPAAGGRPSGGCGLPC